MQHLRRVPRDARRRWPGVLALCAVLATVGLPAGHSGNPVAAAVTDPDGALLFRTHCASCHGTDGTGTGPLAPLLRHVPADLTTLSRRNGGMFPAARVHRIIEGREVASHGDREMPVWGDAFTSRREERSQQIADIRIAAIVRYLESIQLRAAQ